MMEQSESWMDKKVGTSRRRRRQDEVRTGKGVWPLEAGAGAGGGSRLSLVIRDVQEVYQSQEPEPEPAPYGTVQYHIPHPHAGGRNEYHSTSMVRHDNFNLGGPSCRGGKVWPRLQGAGADTDTGTGWGHGRGRGPREVDAQYVPPTARHHQLDSGDRLTERTID